jgi:hypothetical protein
VRTLVAILVSLLGHATSSFAQDLFELEVFEYESAASGEYEVELHTNALSRGAGRQFRRVESPAVASLR